MTWATVGAAGLSLIAMLLRPGTALDRKGWSPESAGEIVGQYLGGFFGAVLGALAVAAVAATILLAFRKAFRPSFTGSYCAAVLVIAGLALGGSLLKRNNRKSAGDSADARWVVQEALQGVKEDIEAMAAATRGPDGLPRRTDLRFDENGPAGNDMQRIRRLWQSYFNDVMEAQNNYLQKLDEAQFDSLLNLDRLTADEEFRESRRMLADASRAVAEMRERILFLLNDVPSRTDRFGFTRGGANDFIAGYRKGLKTTAPLTREYWDLEMKWVEHMAELFDHLEETNGRWGIEEGLFAFEEDDELERFQSILNEGDACLKRQAEIEGELAKATADRFSDAGLDASE